jgi:hypothetical protein
MWLEINHQISLKRSNRCPRNDIETWGTVSWKSLYTLNCLILDCQAKSQSLRPSEWFPSQKISSGWSWCKSFCDIRQISFWIDSIDSRNIACWSRNSVKTFISVYWLQIISFALDSTCVDGRVAPKRKEYAKAISSFLHAAERDGWHYFVIDDESWSFLSV